MENIELTGDYIRGKTAIQKGWPWITPGALGFLNQIIKPEWSIFEWSAGGSTIYFASRCKNIVTIEHSEKWVKWTQQRIKKEGLTNVQLIHAQERVYARQITKVGGKYDLISVDGKVRFKCIELAVSHIKPGGWLMIDNSEREVLKQSLGYLKKSGWEGIHFQSPRHPALAETNKWTTSFYKRV